MNILQPAMLAALLIAQGQALAVTYEVNKNTSMQDDQGGSFSTQSRGSVSEHLSLVNANTDFDNFTLRENPRVVVDGELAAVLSGSQSSYDYTLNGQLDMQVGDVTHAVQFENMSVSRRGLAVEIQGSLLVDGQPYEVQEGSLAQDVIVSLIVLQGQ